MKNFFRVLLAVVLAVTLADAQSAVVKRNVNLRADASTSSDILEKLKPGAQLQLVAPDSNGGFYHVTAPDGQDGWVWGRNITISAAPSPTPTPTPAPGPAGDLFSQLSAAKVTPAPQPLVEDGSQVCGPTGDATNPTAVALNTNKNRTDTPSDYVDINWNDLANLPADRVDDFVGAPVRVVGYLSHRINVENKGSGESTNCHLLGDNEVDWHIYLTNSPAQPISQAVVVEATPRTRPQHKWTTDMLASAVDSPMQVRVSGWLMYDSEHINVIGKERATVWEVHPITKIEFLQNGQWVDLDQQ